MPKVWKQSRVRRSIIQHLNQQKRKSGPDLLLGSRRQRAVVLVNAIASRRDRPAHLDPLRTDSFAECARGQSQLQLRSSGSLPSPTRRLGCKKETLYAAPQRRTARAPECTCRRIRFRPAPRGEPALTVSSLPPLILCGESPKPEMRSDAFARAACSDGFVSANGKCQQLCQTDSDCTVGATSWNSHLACISGSCGWGEQTHLLQSS